ASPGLSRPSTLDLDFLYTARPRSGGNLPQPVEKLWKLAVPVERSLELDDPAPRGQARRQGVEDLVRAHAADLSRRRPRFGRSDGFRPQPGFRRLDLLAPWRASFGGVGVARVSAHEDPLRAGRIRGGPGGSASLRRTARRPRPLPEPPLPLRHVRRRLIQPVRARRRPGGRGVALPRL